MLRAVQKFWYGKDGVAAIEFSFIAPILMALFFAVVEFSHYSMLDRRAQLAVDFTADYLSRDDDGSLTRQERHIVEDIWMMVNPTSVNSTELRNGMWANGYSRALASVEFVPEDPSCLGVNCVLEANLKWSFLFQDSIEQPVSYKCDVDLELADNNAPLNGTNIPRGIVGRISIVIANFVYPYEPLLGWHFVREELQVAALRKTRNAAALEHSLNAKDTFVEYCG